MGILTTTVGWFPKPVSVRRARWQHSEGEIDAEDLRRVEAEATRQTVALQDALGLDVFVDGQMSRADMISFIRDASDGVESGGLVRCFGNRYYRRPRITGELERKGPVTVDAWRLASRHANKPVKAILTGPYTLMDWSFDEHYGERDRCCMALAEIVRAEVEDLVAAGATELQIDEPAISGRSHQTALIARALEHATSGVRGQARTWCHVAYGDLLPVIDAVFDLPVDGLLLEMAASELALFDALERLPSDKLLGAGVVDVLSPEVEDRQTIRGRIDRLLERIPADRLWVVPDSGLRTVSAATAKAKLRSMVEAASALEGS